MSQALPDYVLLWRMAASTQRRHAHAILLCLVLLLAATAGFLVQVKQGDARFTLGVSAGLTLGVMLAGSVVLFLLGAIKLNTPANARLVPRMRRRLMQLAAGAWAATCAVAALLASATPAGAAAFNRNLARATLGNAAFNWGLQVAALVLVTLAAGASAYLFTLLCLCCLPLPLLGTNLRRHAHDAGLLGLGPAFSLLASAGVSIGAGILMNARFGSPVMVGAAAASVLIALVAVPWRRQRSVNAPAAFPVGRLA